MNRYGLLGFKLSHSKSKVIHEYFFDKNNIDATYDLIELEKDQLESQIDLIKNGYYKGYNVTIPYKEEVMKYCDELTIAAKEIGAVNTIYLSNGNVIGDNTDYLGFIDEVKKFNIDLKGKTSYVLGSGGASKAICYALEKMGSNVVIVSRKNSIHTYESLNEISHFDLIVNTTPVGMYPNVHEEILPIDIVKKAECCIDLICNPKQTKFLQYSNRGYNGNYMLIFQAYYAEKLWGNNIVFDIEELHNML